MKQTKKQIYARYGIEYITKGGYIVAPFFGAIKPLLKNGNVKVGKKVYTLSNLPTNHRFTAADGIGEVLAAAGLDSIGGTCPCSCVGCYATVGRYAMPSVKISLAKITILATLAPDFFERAIMAQIEADGIKLVRIHAAGDFINADYAEMWRRIVAACPDTLFWTYTKTKYAAAFDGMKNANIVKSIVTVNGSKYLNFGHCGRVADMYHALKAAGADVYLCPCGISGLASEVHCNRCAACARHEYVLFVEHSTAYNSATDEDLPRIAEILKAQ